MTAGKNHRTYELSLAILNEEIEHESWFSEFLGEGLSGHFLRLGEISPFVSKFFKLFYKRNDEGLDFPALFLHRRSLYCVSLITDWLICQA